MSKSHFIFILLLFQGALFAQDDLYGPSPFYEFLNPDPVPSLINSVDFHPYLNQFCVTATQNHKVMIFRLDEDLNIKNCQILDNPESQLQAPQTAIYAPDGKSLIVANWCGRTFNIYAVDSEGAAEETPIAVVRYPSKLKKHRPHGIALSSDAALLAVAFGASHNDPKGIALFRVENLGTSRVNFNLCGLNRTAEIIEGIPKGVAFSPDGSRLIVTLCKTNSIALYRIEWIKGRPCLALDQIYDSLSGVSRPEDIKFSNEGTLCAISNSSADTVTFYKYDPIQNVFIDENPIWVLDQLKSGLRFPHGLSFSSDDSLFAVTQFGFVVFDEKDDLSYFMDQRKEGFCLFKK